MIYIIITAVLCFILYALYENLIMLSVRREKLGEGVKIAHISDLHKRSFGDGNSRICDKIRSEKPDLIFISGDFVSRDETDFSEAEKTLRKLCSAAPVYMIFGNHEQSIPTEISGDFIAMLGKTEVILLRNDKAEVNINGRELKIFGLEESYNTYKKNGSYRNLDKLALSDVERLLGKCPEGEVFLLAHNPLSGEIYSHWGADCVFSGHVHGGAVRIPFTGKGVLSPERKFFPVYSKGVYNIGKTKLLVSGGLGKLRLFNPPEIVIYEL